MHELSAQEINTIAGGVSYSINIPAKYFYLISNELSMLETNEMSKAEFISAVAAKIYDVRVSVLL